jgi:hypothetical protein
MATVRQIYLTIGLIKIAFKVDFQTVLGITIRWSDTFFSIRYSIGISEVKICYTMYDIPILFSPIFRYFFLYPISIEYRIIDTLIGSAQLWSFVMTCHWDAGHFFLPTLHTNYLVHHNRVRIRTKFISIQWNHKKNTKISWDYPFKGTFFSKLFAMLWFLEERIHISDTFF